MLHARRLRGSSLAALTLLGVLALALAGCSNAALSADKDSAGESQDIITVIVHDSFPGEEFAVAASESTGYDVEVLTAGDGGELTNQLVLTQGAPLADVFFGVDNIFASRILSNDVAEPVALGEMPERAREYALQADDEALAASNAAEAAMIPIDIGATCMNIDSGWFVEQNIAPPRTYEDLIDPVYDGLTVILDPTASSTGASFLIGTVKHFGEDGFVDYWEALDANNARVEQGWTDAYNVQFTQGGGNGTFPIVLSYSSSPAFTVSEDGTETTTEALLDTCSSQIEYAGVLAGTPNPDGAKAVLEYMLSQDFQDTIADAMYVYPVDETAYVPPTWAEHAPMPEPDQVNDLTPAEIDAGRESWLKQLDEAIGL